MALDLNAVTPDGAWVAWVAFAPSDLGVVGGKEKGT